MDELVNLVIEKAVDDRSFLEKVADGIVDAFKAVWSTAFVNDLPDSSFLHILPGGEKDSEGKTTPRDLRMFPYKNASGEIDLAHLRNAIARIPQSNRIDGATKERLQARARKLLSGQKDSTSSFFKDANGQWWYLGIYSNKFEDRDTEILSETSHLKYIDWQKATGFKPVVTVLHQPKMPMNFWPTIFMKYGNDAEKLSEIVKMVYKDFGFAEVQRVMYVNGFTIVAAKVYEDKAHIAEALSKVSDLGMSHGFIVSKYSDNIVDEYRTFEMSVLPRKRAANYATMALFATKSEDDMAGTTMKGLTDEDRKFLAPIYGEEVAAALETGTKGMENLLKDMGLNFKDFEENPMEEDKAKKKPDAAADPDAMDEDMEDMPMKKKEETPETPVAEEKAEEENKEAEKAPLSSEAIADIAKAFNFEALNATLSQMAEAIKSLTETAEAQAKELTELKGVTEVVKELRKTEDEKIAAAITPAWNWAVLGASASKSKENIVTEEEKKEFAKEAPKGTDEPTGDVTVDLFIKSMMRNQE